MSSSNEVSPSESTTTNEPPSDSWVPRSYQKVGVQLMLKQACAGLLYKPGRGKTSVAYMAIRILLEKKFIRRALIISPIRPMWNVWPVQKDKYREFRHLRVGVLHGDDRDAVLVSNDYDIYVINPDSLMWLTNAKKVKETYIGKNKEGQSVEKVRSKVITDPVRVKWLVEKFGDFLLVDESTDFRDKGTNRYKCLEAMLPKFKRRYILTGTPRPKSLMDLFGQIYILDEGDALGRFITHYRTKYFIPDYTGFNYIPQPQAQERIMAKIAPLVQVVEAPIDLPELTFNDLWITLPPKARAIYDKMERELLVLIESNAVVASNAAVASSKCRQIANGGLYSSEEKGVWADIHDEKLQALEDLLRQLQGAPLLITYEFQFDRTRIEEKLGIPCISTGNSKHDNKYIQLFSRGDCPAVLGHPQSISLGIDGLQDHCADIFMYGLTWNLLHYEQVINRVCRSGNPSKKVTVHRALALDTVEERVLEVLDVRDREQKDFMSVLSKIGRPQRSALVRVTPSSAQTRQW